MRSFVITGQVPSLKNSKQLFKSRTTGKMFISSSVKAKAWTTDALWQLKGVKPVTSYPVVVVLEFYFQGNHSKDLDNVASTVLDALVKADVLEDDDWQHITSLLLLSRGIDKANPRVEVNINPA